MAAGDVSGPGKYSKRTDSGPAQKLRALPDAKYGEAKQFTQQQQGAPLAQTPAAPSGQAPTFAPNPAAGAVIPHNVPSQRPNEPVTAGAALGAGPGLEALGIDPAQVEQQDVGKLQNWLSVLEFTANMPDALPGARMLVNTIKAHAP